jgi:pimeloyl-ACP methyl ester carboxylesterase
VKIHLRDALNSTLSLCLLLALVLGGVRPAESAPKLEPATNLQPPGPVASLLVRATGGPGSSAFVGTHVSSDLGGGAADLADLLVFKQPGAANKRPIILVPGMGACYSFSCFLFDIDCDPDDWKWTPLPTRGSAQQLYQPLMDQLAAAGYTEDNHLLTVVFYDWRKPIAESAGRLKAKIDEVKAQTGATQVDLIGHSMGGVVARAYVQANGEARDVAHLIQLGGPNKGAPKAYPYWEGLYLYRLLPEEYTILPTLIYYMVRLAGPEALHLFRREIPSFLEMLPTEDYVQWDDPDHEDPPIPEQTMAQRNLYLAQLNADLASLFAHTDVSAFVGDQLETPMRFYVRERHWWDRPYWDDGEPTWSRKDEFLGTKGDGTVPRWSTELPSPAHVLTFDGVGHSDLPKNQDAIDAIFATLGIPKVAPPRPGTGTDEPRQQLLVLALDGPAHVTVTDPLGRSVGLNVASLTEAEYVSEPSSPFKMVVVPTGLEGTFEIEVDGHTGGPYQLAMLDTFNPPPEVVEDVTALWDRAQSQIEPGTTVEFSLTYTQETSPTTTLVAVTPLIETPLWAGSTTVPGRALPGRQVQVRDAHSGDLLGSATVDAAGHLSVQLAQPLEAWQKIYPECEGKRGVAVTVGGPVRYLPLVGRNGP